MKLIDKKHLHQPFDVPRGQAEALLATGAVEEYKPITFVNAPNTTWAARPGALVEDSSYPPQIFYKCASCGNSGFMEGPTAHRTQKFIHCYVQESVPKEVQERYVELRRAWKEKPLSKRATPNGGILKVPDAVLNTW